MKKIFLLTFLFSLQYVTSQETKAFKYFDIYEDYVENKPIEPVVVTQVKELTPEYIVVGKKLDKATGKTSKKERSAWALEHDNSTYFNMLFAPYIYTWDTFAKFDVVGKNYMLVILDEKTDKKAIGHSNPYGGGLVGAALNMKPKSSWADENGRAHKIVLIDRIVPRRIKSSGLKNVMGYLVDTEKILELSKSDPRVIAKLKGDTYKLEDFLTLIDELNK